MSRMTDLHPDDRQQIHAMIRSIVEQIDSTGETTSTTTVTRSLISELDRLHAAGEAWAGRAVQALAVDGARNRVAAILKEDYATVKLSHSGSVVKLPARLGIRAINDVGQPQRYYQQPLWWELSWERFEALVASLSAQRNALSREIAALREIARLRSQFPDSKTPGEACERIGVDPRQFTLPDEFRTA